MGTLGLKLQRAGLGLATRLVPRRKYQAKVEAIPHPDEKQAGFDLGPWEYLKVPSSDGRSEHRYHLLASESDDAPTMVLLHGLNLDGRTFLGFRDLADRYRLIAYNWPEVNEGYRGRFDDFVALLDDFVRVMGLETFVLGGVSLGGMVAQHYAARRPERVRALILISTKVPNFRDDDHAQSRAMDDLVRSLDDYQIYWVLEKAERRFLRKLPPEDRERAASIMQPKRIEFYRQASAALRDHDGAAMARRLDLPVLFLLGTQDRLIPVETAADARELIPKIKIDLIPGGGHMMASLRSAEVAGAIRDFLEDSRSP